MTLPDRFIRHLKSRKLILPGEKIAIACSGGPDSAACVHLLAGLGQAWNLRLVLIHLNHGLRGKNSNRDARFVACLGARYGIPVYQEKQNLLGKIRGGKVSLEEAARDLRYGFFLREAKRRKIRKIVLAHTLDDQAETVLMRIFQGTGLRGLLGVREQLKREGVLFVRPLLDFTKQELKDYLNRNRFPFCRDESNESPRFLRNRIRLELVPWLKKRVNPNVLSTLARIPKIIKEEQEAFLWMEDEAFRRSMRCLRRNKVFLHREVFLGLPSAIQFRVLDRALKALDPASGVNFEAWQRLRPNLSRPSFRHSFPRDLDLCLTRCRAFIYKKEKQLKKA